MMAALPAAALALYYASIFVTIGPVICLTIPCYGAHVKVQ
jgi:hypothetical protein